MLRVDGNWQLITSLDASRSFIHIYRVFLQMTEFLYKKPPDDVKKVLDMGMLESVTMTWNKLEALLEDMK
ncbi:hypothetical protein P8610_05035 [Fictibacillus sp. UD]|uniref:hypothetical protein n=1 Tax=Fictibacillus sp. UD TaxID=3038777 RepID=UPI0037469BC8